MTVETLLEGWEFLEAPTLDDRGDLWFSDVTLGGLHRLKPTGTVESFLPGRTWIGGIALNDDGAIICSGKEGLLYFHPETGRSRPIPIALDGLADCAVNDFCPDPGGGVVAGLIDAASVAAGRAPEGRPLVRVDADGSTTQLWDGITVSNGIGLSPDGRRLYQSESYRTVWVYDLDPTGRPIDRHVFADIQDADGLAVDAEGGVWIARFDSFEVARFLPDGTRDGGCRVPVREVQSVSFGGPELQDLFIVTGSSFANPNNLTEKTGTIYRTRAAVPGLPLPRTRFRA